MKTQQLKIGEIEIKFPLSLEMKPIFDRKYSAQLIITCQTEIKVHFGWIGNALKFQYLEFIT